MLINWVWFNRYKSGFFKFDCFVAAVGTVVDIDALAGGKIPDRRHIERAVELTGGVVAVVGLEHHVEVGVFVGYCGSIGDDDEALGLAVHEHFGPDVDEFAGAGNRHHADEIEGPAVDDVEGFGRDVGISDFGDAEECDRTAFIGFLTAGGDILDDDACAGFEDFCIVAHGRGQGHEFGVVGFAESEHAAFFVRRYEGSEVEAHIGGNIDIVVRAAARSLGEAEETECQEC